MASSHPHKRYSPACERNKLPILHILKRYFPEQCRILEIASGTGQHADFFSSQQSAWVWQPSDIEPESLDSIESYRVEAKRGNFLTPLRLSTIDESWNVGKFQGAICCNMIHIAPWESCLGLFYHLSRHLEPSSKLAVYGPFIRDEIPTSTSNLSFDQSLRSRDPSWGIRNLKEVNTVAEANGFQQTQVHEMPAHNLTVIFTRLGDCPTTAS